MQNENILKLRACSEQLQNDIQCILDGQDNELLDNACQAVVDRMRELQKQLFPE